MKKMNTRKAAALATVLLMALMGCQSDSPTEPSTGGGGGNNPPSSDIAITLTASNPNPVVGSSAVITARATTAGANVVDGTAIEFATTFGTFIETAEVFALRTTSTGAATVTLTSASAGTAQVTARLGSVVRTIQITFKIEGGGGGTGPTITSVVPNVGPPAGNQVVTIRGTNLKAPQRVFFGSKEATIVSATETEIKAITPGVNLGPTEQSLTVDVRVLTQAGTTAEGGATLTGGYRYELDILTPSVTTVSPSTGPNEGNTRITIFGEGFQSPVKVFFGSGADEVEVEVISVSYSQIQAITPPASGLGAAFINNSVSMRVLNVASNKSVTLPSAFRYGPKIEITGFAPASGSHLGGDRITIYGFGFDDPVSVSIADEPAQVIRVSGTEIVVLTSGLLSCGGGVTGPISVTNLEQSGSSNNTATSASNYTYIVTTKIVSVSPAPLIEGQLATISVQDPGVGNVVFKIGGKTVVPSPLAATSPFGVATFQVAVPTGLTFDEQDCISGGRAGVQQAITDFPVVFDNLLSDCTVDPLTIPVSPISTACVTPAAAANPATGAVLPFGNVPFAGGPSAPIVVVVQNVGAIPLDVSAPQIAAPFIVSPTAAVNDVPPGASVSFNVTFDPTVAGAANGTLTIVTNGGTFTYTLTGTGT